MLPTIHIIDNSGVQQSLDFDFRKQQQPNIYHDCRVVIKKAFLEEANKIQNLFLGKDVVFNIHLEQEKKEEQATTLACFDAYRSTENSFVFQIYYDTILAIANEIVQPQQQELMHHFSDTILHELIHAADVAVLKENVQLYQNDQKLYAVAFEKKLKTVAETSVFEINVQWAFLHFFQVFRNEGVAVLGEKLLSSTSDNNTSSVKDFQNNPKDVGGFSNLLNQVFDIVSGLSFYNSFQTQEAYDHLCQLSLQAYHIGHHVLLQVIQILHPEHDAITEKAIRYFLQHSEKPSADESIMLLQLCQQIDLSDYILAVLKFDIAADDNDTNIKKRLLQCCALIQHDHNEAAISDFACNLGIMAYQKNETAFISTIQSVMGAAMSKDEIENLHAQFIATPHPEDIVAEIKKRSSQLLPLALIENNKVAIWALTYLLDEQDLINDNMAILGWQDDWMVVEGAWRIIDL